MGTPAPAIIAGRAADVLVYFDDDVSPRASHRAVEALRGVEEPRTRPDSWRWARRSSRWARGV